MKLFRIFLLGTILLGSTFVTIILMDQKISIPFAATLSPLFQELGTPVKSANRVVSAILPIDEVDEKALGEELKLLLEKANGHVLSP